MILLLPTPFARDAAGAPVMGRYPGELIVVLFGTLFMGWRPNAPRFRQMLRDVGDTFFYNLSAWVGQFGLAGSCSRAARS